MTILKVPGVRKPLPVRSIVWIAGDDSYAHLYFLNGQHYTITRTLKWFVLQLPDFVRLHKSILVNPVHVTDCQREQPRSALVTVRTGTTFPVAHRRVEGVVKSLQPTKTDPP